VSETSNKNSAIPIANEIVIRPATANDAPAILECLRAAFEPYRLQYTPEAYLDTVMSAEAMLQRLETMSLFVAIDSQDNVIGTIGGGLVSPSEGHLRGMGVLPEWHGRGVARQLLQRIEQELFVKGCTRISLDTTEPIHRAMHFYEKNAYHRSGKLTPYFGMTLIEFIKDHAVA
jgi:GNAT superfamily N-acetyltransferase